MKAADPRRAWPRLAGAGFLCFAAAGCRDAPPREAGPPAAAIPDDRIACRIGEARMFERFCTFEQDGATIVLRKPDGGFRRLMVTDDGRGVVAADGAEPARVTIIDRDRIEVEIGGDSFRLPATVQGS